jgi:hypothetical protein
MWSVSCLCRFSPWEPSPTTHWHVNWVDPRACLNVIEKKNPCACKASNTVAWTPIPYPASHYTDWAFLVPHIDMFMYYAKTLSLNTVGYFCRQDMLCLILWRTSSRQGISEDSCQQLRTWISIKPADGLRRTSFKFLKLYFLEPEILRLIGFGLNIVDLRMGLPLMLASVTVVNTVIFFSFYICLKVSLLHE